MNGSSLPETHPDTGILLLAASKAMRVYRPRSSTGQALRIPTVPIELRFWAKVLVGSVDECWPWQGALDRFGYGSFAIHRDHGTILGLNPNGTRAHRLAFRLTKGPISSDLEVLHSCDLPKCCNPAHLRAGTHLENMSDRTARGRTCKPRLDRHHRAKLTSEIVRMIRREFALNAPSVRALARRYGVGRATMAAVIRRKNWKGVE